MSEGGRKGGTITEEEWAAILRGLKALHLSKNMRGQICTVIAAVLVDQRKRAGR